MSPGYAGQRRLRRRSGQGAPERRWSQARGAPFTGYHPRCPRCDHVNAGRPGDMHSQRQDIHIINEVFHRLSIDFPSPVSRETGLAVRRWLRSEADREHVKHTAIAPNEPGAPKRRRCAYPPTHSSLHKVIHRLRLGTVDGPVSRETVLTHSGIDPGVSGLFECLVHDRAPAGATPRAGFDNLPWCRTPPRTPPCPSQPLPDGTRSPLRAI